MIAALRERDAEDDARLHASRKADKSKPKADKK